MKPGRAPKAKEQPIKRSKAKEPQVIEAIQSHYLDLGSYGLNPASERAHTELPESNQDRKSKIKKSPRAPLFKEETAPKRKTGKPGMCPCGAFFMVDGITSCPRCKR